MIEIRKADPTRECRCCLRKDETVRDIEFKSENDSTLLALCFDCMKELYNAIEREYPEVDPRSQVIGFVPEQVREYGEYLEEI